MPRTLAHKLIEDHLVEGEPKPGSEIGLRIDQTLTQDATGTLVMLELEALKLDRVKTELSCQYVDHNLIQEDYKNPDDHLFLESACRRFGVWYSRPGNGVSHPVHMQRFGKPGKSMLGSDSHTVAAGAIAMLAIGAGGLDVAMAMAGEPFFVKMPKIMGIRLTGELPDWVSAKDVILEVLRRVDVDGGSGYILEYFGPGVKNLTPWDRHTIANMGQETGATTSVFPSDELTRCFFEQENRPDDWQELKADEGADYDEVIEINLSGLVPLIAKPSSPGNVVPVEEIEGEDLYQAYIGSSANPGYRDIAIAAEMVKGRRIPYEISFDINPAARSILIDLTQNGHIGNLLRAGARLHQAGCNGCIGMGQAPATGRNSLRTVPRNFPGRSGTREDSVFLCSPETATASALNGKITDPRHLDFDYPKVSEPESPTVLEDALEEPLPLEKAKKVELLKGPNVESLPELDAFPDLIEVPIIIKVGDDISTDEIMPAGANILPFRSNIPKISEFCFSVVDKSYHDRALEARDKQGGHAIVGGKNYGQGSSREHAAVAPRYLGLRIVLAKSFARIHWQNLVNFGMLPLTFVDEKDFEKLEEGQIVRLKNARAAIASGNEVKLDVNGRKIRARPDLSARQVDVLLKGGVIPWIREKDRA